MANAILKRIDDDGQKSAKIKFVRKGELPESIKNAAMGIKPEEDYQKPTLGNINNFILHLYNIITVENPVEEIEGL